jgi:hypothetical protein
MPLCCTISTREQLLVAVYAHAEIQRNALRTRP